MAATGLQLPLNPNPGARVAQYQGSDTLEVVLRDQGEEAVVQPVWASANFHTILPVVGDPRNYEDLSNFTVTYLSNQEYFRKLEELKAAHAETMVKLQEIHHNQLPLKEVWPGIIRKDGSRSVWEKNCQYPIMTWLSDPDLGWSSSSCLFSSEEDWSNPVKEHPAETRVMPYAKELIRNMWNKFYLRDYMQAEEVHHQTMEKPKRACQKWVPRLTKPKPFHMTIREEKRREDMKANVEMVAKLLHKPEEDPECKKKFRATPVPAHILLPLYHKMVKQNEERRKIAKEKNMELLLASQKPFKFIVREEQKRAAREKQLRDLWMSKKKTNSFKARPVPPLVYSSATSHLKRDISAQVGAPELLQTSSPLPRKAASRRWRNPRFSEQTVLKYKHQVRSQMSDFEDFQKYPSDPKCPEFQPFDAHTSSKLANREEMLADITTDEGHVEETCWSYLSPRRESPVRSATTKSTPCHCSLPVPMVSSKAQEKAAKKSLKDKKMLEEERNRILAKQRQTVRELEKLLVTQAEAHNSHPRLAQVSKSRITNLKKSEKTRLRQH